MSNKYKFELNFDDLTVEGLEQLYHEMRKDNSMNLEVVARLYLEKEKENIMVELEFPCDEELSTIYLSTYSYKGHYIEDATCEDGDIETYVWDLGLNELKNAEQIMLDIALKI